MSVLTVMEIASSALRASAKILKDSCGLDITEFPVMEKVNQVDVWILMDKEDMFVSAVPFTWMLNNTQTNNVCILYATKENILNLFQSFGISSFSSDEDIKTACGKFTDAVTQEFSKEVSSLGGPQLSISAPLNFASKAEEKLDVVGSCHNYGIMYYDDGRHILSMDFIIQAPA